MKGKCLSELPGYERHILIYRAVHKDVNKFFPMDYVTMSRRFAKGHADHQAAIEEEDYHVLSSLVPSSSLYQTPNIGSDEFFYDGKVILGKIIYKAPAEAI